jgi:sugar lactone lactonase YvrE
MKKRSILQLIGVALLGLALLVPTAGIADARGGSLRDRIELPNGFLPEGITIGPGPYAYFGSRADGDIYRANLKTGDGRIISDGNGNQSVGLKSDQRGLLYVAGGASGTGRIISIRTGEILKEYQFTTDTSFVNDVVLSKNFAWFTDSLQDNLYRVPLARRGEPAGTFSTVPLGGDWVQTPGFNANGIALTPNERALLVVQGSTESLFRVNPRTGDARRVNLGGYALTNGDGLLVKGRILYVVQNRLNQVAVFRLSESGRSGRLVDTLTSEDFDVPTTVAAYKGSLFLPNARFDTPQTPTTEFWVTRIDAYGR